MRTEVKFCGITRAEDAAEAARLGASWVGAIFAGGPRTVAPSRAAESFRGLDPAVRRVGVFGAESAGEIAAIAGAVPLDVVQLHGDPEVEHVNAVRTRAGVPVWAVLRVGDTTLPPAAQALAEAADALLLDAKVDGALGGTGRALEWEALAGAVEHLRSNARCTIVLAGGLSAGNVGRAIEVLRPDVVDVSSGVERSPGIKDHDRMRAFMDAVERARMER